MGLPSGASKGFDTNQKDRTRYVQFFPFFVLTPRRHSRGFRSSSQTSLFLDTGGDVIPLAISNDVTRTNDLLVGGSVAQSSSDLLRKSTESKEGVSKGEVSSLSESKPKDGTTESQGGVNGVKSFSAESASVAEEAKVPISQTAMSTSQEKAIEKVIESNESVVSATVEAQEKLARQSSEMQNAINNAESVTEVECAIATTVIPVDEIEEGLGNVCMLEDKTDENGVEKTEKDAPDEVDANDEKEEKALSANDVGKDCSRESAEERPEEEKAEDAVVDKERASDTAKAMAAKAALDPQAIDQSALMTNIDLLIKKMTDPVANEAGMHLLRLRVYFNT
jgi:hypothetical protein